MLCQANTASTSELVRLASFSEWPKDMTEVSLIQLAMAGFRYAGDSDAIVCDYCDRVFSGWLGTRHNPLLEHRSSSNSTNPPTHHNGSAENNINVPTSGRYEETVGSCYRTVPKSKSDVLPMPKSCDKTARGLELDAVNRDSNRLTRMLEADEVPRAATPSRHTALGVEDITKSSSGDVRDAAAANFSKSLILVL